MPICPHCLAELDVNTLRANETPACPHCEEALDLDSKDWDLSSHAGGSPADATMRPGEPTDSSLAGSSLAGSSLFRSDEASDPETPDSSGDPTGDNTLEASPNLDDSSSDDLAEKDAGEPDMTMVFGGKYTDEDDSFDIALEESDEADDESLPMDATIDYAAFQQQGGVADPAEPDATIAHGGLAPPNAGDDDLTPPDLTQMAGTGDRPGLISPLEDDATLQLDSDRPDSDPGSGGSSLEEESDWPEAGSSGSDPAQTESPSTFAGDSASDQNSATLAFDSNRRSDRVDTPDPIDITGLSTGRTIPRGPLEEGRGSESLKPGQSQLVGAESVRLRAFRIGEDSPELRTDPEGIDYAIEGEAGKGGMGVVYKARQQSMDRLVALKQIKSEAGSSESDRNKFISEAVITGQLEHPNIAPVHDLGLAADGLPFYAMKFVEGEDWEDSIKRLSEEENLSILIQVAQAIAFAHSKNILHRDLKPGNVRLGSFGEVLVMDWGLAARLDDGSEIQPAGTPIYMPPETALEYLDYAKGRVSGGKGVSSSRKRSPAGTYGDVYLLGALLFKIITGRAPHRGKTTFECLRNAAKNEIIKVRRSSELLDIAYKAMATDPEDRHASATDFIDAIKSYQAHAQSILIAKRASRELRAAEKLRKEGGGDVNAMYASFSRAQHGYQNALDLWSGNRKATRRLKKTRRLFAEAAYANGDYDLALSMLDERNEDDAELRASVVDDQKSRKARLAWFKTLQYATAASLMLALAFIGYSVYASLDAFSARNDLAKTEARAEQVTRDADAKVASAEKLAADAKRQADEDIARGAKEAAATVAAGKADAAEEVAEGKRIAAQEVSDAQEEAARVVAEANQRVEAAEQLAAALAAEAKFNEIKTTLFAEGPYAASKLVAEAPEVRQQAADNPSWSTLLSATDLDDEVDELIPEEAARPGTRLAGAGGEWTVTAIPNPNGGATLTVYAADGAEPGAPIETESVVERVAIDPTGRYVAVAGGAFAVYDAANGQPLRFVDEARAESGNQRRALTFNPKPTGQPELLVAGAGTSIERWVVDGTTLRLVESEDEWHRVEVVAVGYSPDGRQRFSADGEGRVVLRRHREPTPAEKRRAEEAGRTVAAGWLDRETFDHASVASGSPRITSVAMTADEAGRLAYGCDDGAVYEFAGWWLAPNQVSPTTLAAAKRLPSGYLDVTAERLRTTHPDAVSSVAYAEGGDTVLSAGGDTLLVRRAPGRPTDARASEAQREEERRYHDAKVTSCVAGTGGHAFSCDEKGRVLRWKINVEPDALVIDPPGSRGAGVASIRVRPAADGAVAVTVADLDGYVRHWEDIQQPGDSSVAYAGHADHRGLRAWAVPGETPRVVTVAADGRACVWRQRSGLLERVIDLGGRSVVAIDADAATLYAATDGLAATDGGPAAVAYPIAGGEARPLWAQPVRAASLLPLSGAERGALAVGLRDGQVFLWRPGSGRAELIPSTRRPHWRAIRSIAYDADSGRLYTGDGAGLLARWGLTATTAPTTRRLSGSEPEPLVRIAPLDGGRLLVVRGANQGLTPLLINEALEPLDDASLALTGLRSVAADRSSGRLVGLQETANRTTLVEWSPEGGWRPAPLRSSIGEPPVGMASTADGLLTWGGRTVSAWEEGGDGLRLVSRIISRPPARTLLGDAEGGAAPAVTAIGSIDRWDADRSGFAQRDLGVNGAVTASVAGPGEHEAIFAVSRGGTTAVERWDVQRRQRTAVLVEPTDGRCRTLTLSADALVAAFDDRVVVAPLSGRGAESFDLPAEAGRPIGVATNDAADQLVVVGDNGLAQHARRGPEGWRLTRLDREDVTSAAFTPDADTLAVGVQNGRVLLLQLGAAEEGVHATRPMLTFGEHSASVTRLRVAPLGEGTTLVSGDAAGRVVVRNL